jgi:hypothetical protein
VPLCCTSVSHTLQTPAVVVTPTHFVVRHSALFQHVPLTPLDACNRWGKKSIGGSKLLHRSLMKCSTLLKQLTT